MENINIAVLMTCYNRREKTKACLAALFNQVRSPYLTIAVYLVDDGSTDGTSTAIGEAYPQVKIVRGDGSLFWNGGMRVAFAEAIKSDCDYHLWLNDDTLLYPEALATMLAAHQRLAEQGYSRSVVIGSTRDSQTGVLTYGGMVRKSRWRPLKFYLVEPGEKEKRCDTLNGNCVLIPREVIQLVGNLDSAFTHYLGDFDYGLRSQQQGSTLWIAPGYVGTCSQNVPQRNPKQSQTQLSEGLKKMNQPKGLSVENEVLYSFSEWKAFSQRHGGILWPLYLLLPYRRLIWISIFGNPQGKGA